MTPKFKIALIGAVKGNPFPIQAGIEQCFEMDFKDRYLMLNSNDLSKGTEKLIDFKPDFVLIHDNRLDNIKRWQGVLGAIRQKGCKVVIWFNDLMNLTGDVGFQHPYNIIDAIFLCNRDYLANWSKYFDCPAYYMPQGCMITEEPKLVEEFIHDMVFIGQFNHDIHERRTSWWEEIKHHCPNSGIYNGNKREERAVITRDSNRLYRQSEFCFVCSPNVWGYNSNRLYNVLAAGGLALVATFNGIEDLLVHKKTAIIADNATVVPFLIRWCRDNPEEYEKIRMAGWKLSQEKHTSRMRIFNMLNHIYYGEHEFWGTKD